MICTLEGFFSSSQGHVLGALTSESKAACFIWLSRHGALWICFRMLDSSQIPFEQCFWKWNWWWRGVSLHKGTILKEIIFCKASVEKDISYRQISETFWIHCILQYLCRRLTWQLDYAFYTLDLCSLGTSFNFGQGIDCPNRFLSVFLVHPGKCHGST
jgi:hypothetical protein